jgi:hypothetical protein
MEHTSCTSAEIKFEIKSTEPGYNEWYELESHVEEPLRGEGGSSFKGGESEADYAPGFEGTGE